MKISTLPIICTLILFGCRETKEMEAHIDSIHKKIEHIDSNRRIRIVEDDFHTGDSIFKIRGYFHDELLQKVVSVLHTNSFERNDYFYFENHNPIFSGHVMISKVNRTAEEYKYYYGHDGFVRHALFWEDHYSPGKQFPHEHFVTFDHDKDSIRSSEEDRLQYLMGLLDLEGVEIKHLNENLGANRVN